MSVSNAVAPWNIERILVTRLTSQPEMSATKPAAPWNIDRISRTCETSQALRPPVSTGVSSPTSGAFVSDVAFRNAFCMLVVALKSGASTAVMFRLAAPSK